jgi:hypothetical protein
VGDVLQPCGTHNLRFCTKRVTYAVLTPPCVTSSPMVSLRRRLGADEFFHGVFGGARGLRGGFRSELTQSILFTSENHRFWPKTIGAGFCSILIVFSALFAPQKRRSPQKTVVGPLGRTKRTLRYRRFFAAKSI